VGMAYNVRKKIWARVSPGGRWSAIFEQAIAQCRFRFVPSDIDTIATWRRNIVKRKRISDAETYLSRHNNIGPHEERRHVVRYRLIVGM
jgi:hypothetical protein